MKSMEFHLTYKSWMVGSLRSNGSEWSFEYSEWFKNQSKILPVFDFPDTEKVYTFQRLVPFFALRIPGLKQPKIRKILVEERLNKTDEAALLARFGKRCIANPFHLKLMVISNKTIQ